jgi:acyl carrier protein
MDKTRRRDLADAFYRGEYVPHRLQEKPAWSAASAPQLSATERRLAEIWQQVLERERSPSPNENFYDLGGDSFASAALIACVEAEFKCELPIENFFKDPTITNMAALLASGARYFNGSPRDSHSGLLQALRSYTGSWRGERLVREGLIAGANISGTKDPVFWVFQNESQFERLGARLGPDQPLYGLRSLVGIVPIREYPRVLDLVVESYLKEILTLQAPRLIVGGNCQGGIIALALARKLKYAGRMPAPLVLMEWLYNYGRYTGPTVLLYGKKSHSAKRFESEKPDDLKWQADFPQRSITTVPGRHGKFFTKLNLDHLATALSPYLS